MWTRQTLWMFLSLGVQPRVFIVFEEEEGKQDSRMELKEISAVI